MRAQDVMTTNVVSVKPETDVKDVALLLLENRVSAVPVIDNGNKLIGMLSEGDLIRRVADESVHSNSSWLEAVFSTRNLAAEFTKIHAKQAKDVMTAEVISVNQDVDISEIASLLAKHHVKRVPVIDNGQVVGIVSRANLLQGLAVGGNSATLTPSSTDSSIRDQIIAGLREAGISDVWVNVIVEAGKVQLWGLVETDEERKAAYIAADKTLGVTSVETHLGLIPAYLWAE